jgi:hypothetical protein
MYAQFQRNPTNNFQSKQKILGFHVSSVGNREIRRDLNKNSKSFMLTILHLISSKVVQMNKSLHSERHADNVRDR